MSEDSRKDPLARVAADVVHSAELISRGKDPAADEPEDTAPCADDAAADETVEDAAPAADAPALRDPADVPAPAALTPGQACCNEMPDEEVLYDLADLFKVFADTTRIKILYALMVEDLNVSDLAEAVGGVSQSAVSHQLRILKQAHLVRFRREGKQVIYALSDDHVYTMLSQGLSHICE
jgi:DNA-binding transcriptional ArsR family regulator